MTRPGFCSTSIFCALALLLVFLPGLLAAGNLSYTRALFEREPNDTPEQAQSFRGTAQVVGELPAGDVDHFWWVVEEEEADRLWRVTLNGQTTDSIRLLISWPAEDGDDAEGVMEFGATTSTKATEAVELLELNIDRRRTSQASHELLIPPGDHLITVSGSGAYELLFEDTRRAAVHRRIEASHASPQNLWGEGNTIDREEIEFNLPVNDPADALWGLILTAELDRRIEAELMNADGTILKREQASGLHVYWSALPLDPGARLRLKAEQGQTIGRLRYSFGSQGMRSQPDRQRARSEAETRWFKPGETVIIDQLDQQREYLAFSLDEQQAEQGWNIVLETEQEATPNVCLHRRRERASICRSQPDGKVFESIQLDPGHYDLRLQGQHNQPAARVQLSLIATDRPPANQARQPNNIAEWAAPVLSGEAVHGRFAGDQRAWFELRVGEPARYWSISAQSAGLSRLFLYPGGTGNALLTNNPTSDSDEIRMENLWLEPGLYRIQLHGKDADYRLLARPQDRPAGDWELEPNDHERQANRITLGEPMHGTVHASNDSDHYYFELPGWNYLNLVLEPVAGQTLRTELSWAGQRIFMTQVNEERPLDFGQLLPPGDYLLSISGSPAPGQPYRILTELRSPRTPAGPEQSGVSRALPINLPPSGEIELRHGVFGHNQQLIALPVSDQPREVRVNYDGGRFGMVLTDERGAELPIETGEGNERYFELASGQRAWLSLRLGNPARTIHFTDPALTAAEDSAVEMTLTAARGLNAVAAYRPEAQRLPMQLHLRNEGDQAETLSLKSHASHAGARLNGLPRTLSLGAGESRQIDIEWELPPTLGSDTPLMLHVMSDGAEARLDVEIEPGRSPLNPKAHQSIPQELLGLTDLAWSALGARFIDEQGETVEEHHNGERVRLQHLIDGMSSGGSTMQWRGSDSLPTLVLAGGGGRLHGFMFNARSSLNPNQRWQRLRIESAIAPGQWQPLIEVELDSHDGEQYVLLEQSAEARYLRLTPLANWGNLGDRDLNGIGLFRALGEPLGELAEKRHDLLASELGGHWVYSRPAESTPDDFPHHARPQTRGVQARSDTVELVYAFLQHRGGYIDSLAWEEDLDWAGEAIEQIQVMTATESPLGPWMDHGLWQLQRNEAGRARYDLPAAIEARYLRLVLSIPDAPEGRGNRRLWRAPTAIRAYEAHGLGRRRSLLGHWGMDDASGPFGPPGGLADGLEIDDRDSSPARPWLLDTDVRGELAQPGDRRSYRIALAEPDNSLQLQLRESQLGRLRAELIGPDDAPVDLDWQQGADGWRQAAAIGLDPGQYRLDLVEPPRSIIFMWDGSGSVAALQPAIYQALNRFAEGLIPGQEAVNLVPLGGPLLIDGWAEAPREISRTLAAYDGRFTSSNSEPSLILASSALQQRQGERIIFLMTDAELLGRDLSVWNSFERTRPRVMALEISHGNPRDAVETRGYQNLMKAWAHAAGGEYYYTMDRATLIRSFEAAMDRIRQPSQFELNVERDYIEPPQPGELMLVSADKPVVAGGAIHLIFDASGSMLRRMEGGRRIDVARRIVRDVLEQQIPPEVPVALRAFGHTEPHSCATELLVAPATGNRQSVLDAVDRIQAINLARTPLAASLDAVAADLVDYQDQRRLVVMFTDGEETCDGDVEASVLALVEDGVNVRLNIVGFHIDELGLQDEFERFAALGGGEYFDTRDSAGLSESLVQALAAPYRVYDRNDEEVGRGRVDGEALTLPPGRYRVVIEAAGGDREMDIELVPSASLQIEVE